MEQGPFPRVTKSDDCGISKELHFSWKPVLKREFSHYFLVRCHKRQVNFRASNEHLMRHERLASFLCANKLQRWLMFGQWDGKK